LIREIEEEEKRGGVIGLGSSNGSSAALDNLKFDHEAVGEGWWP
jgi:hypothetical protein